MRSFIGFFLMLCCVSSVYSKEKDFVIGDLVGQLGNQCFEIAAVLSVAWDNDAEALFPDLFKSNMYDIPLNRKHIFWRFEPKLPKKKVKYYYKEPHYHYAKIPYHPNMRIHGYFQSERYFKHHKEKIIKLFEPKKEIVSYIKKKIWRAFGASCNCCCSCQNVLSRRPHTQNLST